MMIERVTQVSGPIPAAFLKRKADDLCVIRQHSFHMCGVEAGIAYFCYQIAAKAPPFRAGDESRAADRRENTRHLFSPLLYCLQFFCTLRSLECFGRFQAQSV